MSDWILLAIMVAFLWCATLFTAVLIVMTIKSDARMVLLAVPTAVVTIAAAVTVRDVWRDIRKH